MNRWPGAVSSSTSPAASSTSSAANSASNSLINRRAQSRLSRRWAVGGASLETSSSATLKRLAERDGDRQRSIALLPIERNADVDPDWPEARIVTGSDSGGE